MQTQSRPILIIAIGCVALAGLMTQLSIDINTYVAAGFMALQAVIATVLVFRSRRRSGRGLVAGIAHLTWVTGVLLMALAFVHPGELGLGIASAGTLGLAVLLFITQALKTSSGTSRIGRWIHRLDLALALGAIVFMQWVLSTQQLLESLGTLEERVRWGMAPVIAAALIGAGLFGLLAGGLAHPAQRDHQLAAITIGLTVVLSTWTSQNDQQSLSLIMSMFGPVSAIFSWRAINQQSEHGTDQPRYAAAGTAVLLLTASAITFVTFDSDAIFTHTTFRIYLALISAGFVRLWFTSLSHHDLQSTARSATRAVQSRNQRDDLTGLMRYELAVLQPWRELTGQSHNHLTVALNLRHFHRFNEIHGYARGDSLLQAVGDRLSQIAQIHGGTATRVGGDEFALLVSADEPAAAETIVGSFVTECSAPYRFPWGEAIMSFQVGWTLTVDESVEQALQQASVALHSTSFGRSAPSAERFVPSMLDHDPIRVDVARELKEALSDGQFELLYQPIFDLATRNLVGAEAFLRWIHPTRGSLAPAQFLPAAVEFGILPHITSPLMCEAIRRFAALNAGRTDPLALVLNLDFSEINDNRVVEQLRQTIVELGPQRFPISLDVTPVGLTDRGHHNLIRLRKAGVTLGLNSIAEVLGAEELIRRHGVEDVKFRRRTEHSVEEPYMVIIGTAITGLASGFGSRVTAVGVETQAHEQAAIDVGCHRAQGNYYSPPLRYSAFVTRWGQLADTGPERFENTTAPANTASAATTTT